MKSIHRHRLAFHLERPIRFVDVGARGKLEEPWASFPEGKIQVVGFEPDAEECKGLNQRNPNSKFHPVALWSEKGRRTFYLNRNVFTSSMFPPNEVENRQFEEEHWVDRVVARQLSVECDTLDAVLDEAPDFIKIDTQGAEYEILAGARRILREGAPLVVAETWLQPVYSGQKLCHEVIGLMASLGYTVFELGIAAAWRYQTGSGPCASKPRKIGLDLLFVKDAEELLALPLPEDRFMTLCALLELYGFRDYALHLIGRSGLPQGFRSELAEKLKANDQWDARMMERLGKGRIARRALRLFGITHDALYPRLHY